jgi:hypothetical protein
MAHVTSSIGWIGAVASFLALAVTGVISDDSQKVQAAYLAMNLIAWLVIVPMSLLSPATGLILSYGTGWGFFRHYWVSVKILVTVPSCILLFVHLNPIGHLARVVSNTALAHGDLAGQQMHLAANAAAAMVVLLVATALSIYKPSGKTRLSRRKRNR